MTEEQPQPRILDQPLYDQVTRQHWLDELTLNRHWNRRHLFCIFSLFGTPATMLDVGCGLGEEVMTARVMQIDAWGVDQLVDDEYNEEWFFHHDLRHPFSLAEYGHPSIVNLVLSMEVAEHIPEEYEDVYVDTLANHLSRDEGSILVFTCAHPGQSGTEHVNVKPATHWRDKFYKRGLNYREERTRQLALLWSNIGSPLWWLASNVQVFSR